MLNKILTGVYLLIGLYFTYSGIVKKGKMYDNSNIAKEKKEQFTKYMSLFLVVSGPVLCAGAGMELLNTNPLYYALCYGLVIVFASVLIYKMRTLTKRV